MGMPALESENEMMIMSFTIIYQNQKLCALLRLAQ